MASQRMRSRGRFPRSLLDVCALLVVLGPCLFGCSVEARASEQARPQDFMPIELGVTTKGELDVGGTTSKVYFFEVPVDAVELQVDVRCSRGDIDLFLGHKMAATSEDQADLAAHSEGGRARLVVSRFSRAVIAQGRWYAHVGWGFTTLPTSSHEPIARVPFEITVKVMTTRADGEAPLCKSVRGTIDPLQGSWRTYWVQVPEGSEALRIDLARTASDLDLFARHGRAATVIAPDVAFAEHPWGRETLLIRPGDPVPLRPGMWYIDVCAGFAEERSIDFELLVTLSSAVPDELRTLPSLAQHVGATGPLERALAAVAEIATDDGLGSATLVSSDGKLLTSAHVVEKLGGGAVNDVVVALTLDPHSSAVELFRASVIRFDETLDLALLQVVSGFYGDPLPAGYVFPCIELGSSSSLVIGAPLWLVGYPSTGGLNSRVTITATRGIVSGFDQRKIGRVLKTDAELTNGNSGGAALDENGRFVGVPSSTVENGSGQLGYVVPIEVLPEDWLAPTKPR